MNDNTQTEPVNTQDVKKKPRKRKKKSHMDEDRNGDEAKTKKKYQRKKKKTLNSKPVVNEEKDRKNLNNAAVQVATKQLKCDLGITNDNTQTEPVNTQDVKKKPRKRKKKNHLNEDRNGYKEETQRKNQRKRKKSVVTKDRHSENCNTIGTPKQSSCVKDVISRKYIKQDQKEGHLNEDNNGGKLKIKKKHTRRRKKQCLKQGSVKEEMGSKNGNNTVGQLTNKQSKYGREVETKKRKYNMQAERVYSQNNGKKIKKEKKSHLNDDSNDQWNKDIYHSNTRHRKDW